MIPTGQFTVYDLNTIGRAALLAEGLAVDFFGLPRDEWIRNPYGVLTRKQIDPVLYEADVFAQVVQYKHSDASSERTGRRRKKDFGIILQDPHILRALLRSSPHDLWSLALYIMTHELIHIIRFRRREAQFSSTTAERDKEERLVHGMTREILAGIPIMESVLSIYGSDSDIPRNSFTLREGGEFHAHI